MTPPAGAHCPDDETLARFAEGALSAADAAALGAHAESCASCRRLLAALVKLRSSLEGRMPAGDASPVAAGTTLGRYVVRRRVGAGAMGVVHEAHDPALDRRVALKLLRGPATDEALERLVREAQVMAQLSHPNVAAVYDVGTFEGRSWVAMEFIDGVTLREWLRAAPRSPGEVEAALLDAARGLAAAHERGLVHRDFKPDNVLIERAADDARGRVVVIDFGLAASEGDSRPTSASPRLTRTGALVGTPAYMAPEQLAHLVEGAASSASTAASVKSDQFAFCVTCVEAFSGRRPFEAATLPELAGRLRHDEPDAAALAAVPARVRKLVRRGLSRDPEARLPSMHDLVRQLEPRPGTPRLLLGTVALALVAVLAIGAEVHRRARVCSGAEARVAGVWNDALEARVRAAFANTGQPWASAAADGLAAELRTWAADWRAAWTDACEATNVRHEQSDELLDLRLRCLDERLTEVKALGPVLERPDASTLSAASTLVGRLSPISACADEQALRAPVREPTDPPTVERVAQARVRLAELVALRAAGQYRAAREAIGSLAGEAASIGWRPLEAEVALLAAQLEETADDFDQAVSSLERAQVAAQAGGHVLASGQAWALLVRVEGSGRAHYAEAHRAAALAAAVSERLGAPLSLESLLARNLGGVLSDEGRHAEAKTAYEKALKLQRDANPGGVEFAASLNALGNEVRRLGDAKAALALYEEALELLTRQLGPKHPDVASVLKNIGNVHWQASELDEALTWYQKARALQEEAFGVDSLEVVATRNNEAGVLIRQGKLAAAEEALCAVMEVQEKRLGADHPALFGPLNNLAVVLRYAERAEEAEQALRRALSIVEKAHGPEHEDVATTLLNLGDVQLSRGDARASVASYERAVAVTAKTSGPEHADLADCYGGLALALLELHDYRRALEASERALAIYVKSPGMPLSEGQVHFAHAQAAWASGAKHRRSAVEEARAARETLAKSGAQPSELAEVDAWLAGK